MQNIRELIKNKRIYFDGGMGTMLQQNGLQAGELPEAWNILHSDIIESIHRQYLSAGANIITTNTFGVNPLKHGNYKELIIAAVNAAKRAKSGFDESFIAFDIGPIGKFLEPIGDLPFEDAVELFAKNVRVANECGVDLIIIETMTDAYETKAAVLAAKENSKLPVFVTNVYDGTEKTLTGSSPEAMIALLEGLSVDAIGINCSLGPDKMLPLVEKYKKYSSLPIICNPNAGMPQIVNGQAHYAMQPVEFAEYAARLAISGADILGGCCGTTPEYISALVARTGDIPLTEKVSKRRTVVSSYTHTVDFDSTTIIGERINPTGKPRLKEALKNNNMSYILEQGLLQSDNGAHILDVNVGLPEINESEMMPKVIKELQAVCDIPLSLDSNSKDVLERSMRLYNGKPLVNSVNGDIESMNAVFPLVKKYGGIVIALTLDKNGIPQTAEGRVDIAKRILKIAEKFGVADNDIIFDPLALTIATDINNAQVTVDTVKKLNGMGLKTVLGVSNISFGMPNRDIINSSFFSLALSNGLNAAIINPLSPRMMNAYHSHIDGSNNASFADFLQSVFQEDEQTQAVVDSEITLEDAILRGMIDLSVEKTKQELEKRDPMQIINCEIIPALNKVGDSFDKQMIFLPQLLRSAECSSKAFALIKDKIPAAESNGNTMIIATVKGDIHDIGKNIVKLLLESYGFTVYDLGKDVAPEAVLEAVKRYNCKLVGLSALMTTTLPAMKETVQMLHEYDGSIKVIVGGAVLNSEYADMIGADVYGKDAIATVKYAQSYYKK